MEAGSRGGSPRDGLAEGGRRASVFLDCKVQEVIFTVRLCPADSETRVRFTHLLEDSHAPFSLLREAGLL